MEPRRRRRRRTVLFAVRRADHKFSSSGKHPSDARFRALFAGRDHAGVRDGCWGLNGAGQHPSAADAVEQSEALIKILKNYID